MMEMNGMEATNYLKIDESKVQLTQEGRGTESRS
jgi:hypothetical protein